MEKMKIIEEERHKTGSLKRYISKNRPLRSLPITKAQEMQSFYLNYIQSSLLQNPKSFIRQLNLLKKNQADTPRKERVKFCIFIDDEEKTGKDYFRNDLKIGNARNPFIKYPEINYEIDHR